MPGRFAAEPVLQPLVAKEAFVGESNFYVSFEGADGLVYAGGNWSNRIDIEVLERDADGTYAGPYILPLEYQQHDRWASIPESPL
ncbi:MAG: hypothetical protein GY953_23690, partial [bacterium]|nr:hypothetical protein [bacterium]